MTRLAVIVEGATEKRFVGKILTAHLRAHKIYSTPVLIGGGDRGGNVSLDRISSSVKNLAYDFDAVTTLVDYYGFKKRGSMTVADVEREIVERAPAAAHEKIIPYVQKYEFEALLFSDPAAVVKHLCLSGAEARQISGVSQNPEEINDNAHPSQRLKAAHSRYNKALNGVEIAELIGLPAIMAKCPRFAAWVRELENLGGGD